MCRIKCVAFILYCIFLVNIFLDTAIAEDLAKYSRLHSMYYTEKPNKDGYWWVESGRDPFTDKLDLLISLPNNSAIETMSLFPDRILHIRHSDGVTDIFIRSKQGDTYDSQNVRLRFDDGEIENMLWSYIDQEETFAPLWYYKLFFPKDNHNLESFFSRLLEHDKLAIGTYASIDGFQASEEVVFDFNIRNLINVIDPYLEEIGWAHLSSGEGSFPEDRSENNTLTNITAYMLEGEYSAESITMNGTTIEDPPDVMSITAITNTKGTITAQSYGVSRIHTFILIDDNTIEVERDAYCTYIADYTFDGTYLSIRSENPCGATYTANEVWKKDNGGSGNESSSEGQGSSEADDNSNGGSSSSGCFVKTLMDS